jgi:hypothetical protein
MNDSYTFCSYEAIFPQSLPRFIQSFVNVDHDTVHQCGKSPCLDLRKQHQRYKESLNKLRQRITEFVRPET